MIESGAKQYGRSPKVMCACFGLGLLTLAACADPSPAEASASPSASEASASEASAAERSSSSAAPLPAASSPPNADKSVSSNRPTQMPIAPSAGGGPRPVRAESPVALSVADPHKADVDTLVPQLLLAALTIDAHATLNEVFVRGALDANGHVDLMGEAQPAVSIDFGVHYLDSSKPPGADLQSGMGSVMTSRDRCASSPAPCVFIQYVGVDLGRAPITLPDCTLSRAWAAVLGSGVPANTVTSLITYSPHPSADAFGADSRPPGAWFFMVTGHEELQRFVDGATCMTTK
ncbi:MAG: hypothetical protein U0271_31630 [Polyangiaceae bacterium]